MFSAHNTDLGDGWERESENSDHFRTISEPRAYPFAVNVIFYSMTLERGRWTVISGRRLAAR